MNQIKFLSVIKDKTIVYRHDSSETLGSGILFAPENQIERSIWCTVIMTGKKSTASGKLIDQEFKPGDVVLLRQWSGEHVSTYNSQQVLVTHSDLIEAINTELPPHPEALRIIEENAKAAASMEKSRTKRSKSTEGEAVPSVS